MNVCPTLVMRSLRYAFSLALGCFLVSCSTFDTDYQEMLKRPPDDDIQGAWEGTWRSSGDHGSGRLWCIVSKDDGHEYEFRYRAEWKKVLRAEYRLFKKVHRKEETYTFSATKDLGSYGSFTMSGAATPTIFNATYDSKFDKGTFLMGRPAEVKEKN